ncbi:MAG TPA: tail-specific protease, partial [Planctomycetaceae bacterium]|nr:tail-specific protease [Planctomycetaceae bacterium]
MTTLRSISRCTLLMALMTLVLNSATAAEKVVLTAEDGKTAQIVAAMVSNKHINHPEINDALSEKLLKRYIEIWDPQKLYFLQSDIDEFSKQKDSLDDQILRGDVQFAATVYERFRSRLDARAAQIDPIIDMDHDFAVEEEMIRDAKEIPWAKDEVELNERWR